MLLSFGASGCWSGRSSRNPRLAPGQAIPSPTLLIGAVSCLGGDDAAGGRIVTSAAGYGAMAIDSTNAQLLKLGQVMVPFHSSLCAELLSSAAIDADDWKHPAAPPAIALLAKELGAGSVLVPAVTTKQKCTRGVWSNGQMVETGTAECRESEITMTAYLFAADGTVLWKSLSHVAIGPLERPDFASGAQKLLGDAPIQSAVQIR